MKVTTNDKDFDPESTGEIPKWLTKLYGLRGNPTKHPGSKVPVKMRVERRRKANKRAAASRKANR